MIGYTLKLTLLYFVSIMLRTFYGFILIGMYFLFAYLVRRARAKLNFYLLGLVINSLVITIAVFTYGGIEWLLLIMLFGSILMSSLIYTIIVLIFSVVEKHKKKAG